MSVNRSCYVRAKSTLIALFIRKTIDYRLRMKLHKKHIRDNVGLSASKHIHSHGSNFHIMPFS